MANVSIEQDCFQEGVSIRNFQNARRFVPSVPRYELWLGKHGGPALLLHRNGLRAGFSDSWRTSSSSTLAMSVLFWTQWPGNERAGLSRAI